MKIVVDLLVSYILYCVYLHKETNKEMKTTADKVTEETINFLRAKLDEIRDSARANEDGAFDLQTRLYGMVSKLEGDVY